MPTANNEPDNLQESTKMLQIRRLSEKIEKGEVLTPMDNIQILEEQALTRTHMISIAPRNASYVTRKNNTVSVTLPYGAPGVYGWPSTKEMWGLELIRLGQEITKQRKQLRLTKKETGRRAGISGVTVRRIEKSRTTNITAYFKVAEVLGVKIRIT